MKVMTSNNVISLTTVRTIREMNSLQLMNCAWYCNNYPEKLESDVRDQVISIINTELIRRERNGVRLYEDLAI